MELLYRIHPVILVPFMCLVLVACVSASGTIFPLSAASDGPRPIPVLKAVKQDDGILFRMAEMHLTPVQNEKVARLFPEVEKRAKELASVGSSDSGAS